MRTPHRSPAIGPVRRTALASALALAFGASEAAAQTPPTDRIVSDTSQLAAAIDAFNSEYATGQIVPDCNGRSISLNGVGAFVVSSSSPLPALACPGITVRTPVSWPYGGQIMGSNASGICGLSATEVVNIDRLEISGFTYGGAGLCGRFASVKGSYIHDNDYGIWVNQSQPQIPPHMSDIGGTGPDRNVIVNNAWHGVKVDSGVAARIHDNYIGVASNGATASPNYTGVGLYGAASVVEDNLISGNSNLGVEVDDAGGSFVRNNLIGTDASGTTALTNYQGIVVWSGPTTIDNNLVSGNEYGITMYAAGSVTNNKVGVDASGMMALGGYDGIAVSGAAVDVRGNHVADQSYNIDLQFADGSTVTKNRIGVDAVGGALNFSYGSGISVYCSNGVQVGNAADSGSGNIIGAQWYESVFLDSSGGNTVAYNTINVGPDGTTPLGNYGYGVLVSGSSSCSPPAAQMAAKRVAIGGRMAALPKQGPMGNLIQGNKILGSSTGVAIAAGLFSSNNQIVGNTIAGSSDSGVAIRDAAAIDNAIVDNAIYNNYPKNIELYIDSIDPTLPLANDPGDTDTGPNEGLNYPQVGSVTDDGTSTLVTYTLDTPTDAPHDFLVQFFTTPNYPQPGGESLVGQEVRTGVVGVQTFTRAFPTGTNHLSLTSTLQSGGTNLETSEFSPVATSTPLPAVAITPSGFNFGNVEVGDGTAPTQTFTLASSGTAAWIPSTFTTSGSCPVSAAPLGFSCGADYVCTTTCTFGSSYAPGTSCTITAQFAPSATGASSVGIRVCDNTATAKTIAFSGNGMPPPPLAISPASFDFGSVLAGASSANQTFTITNPAKTSVTLSAPVATSPFAVTSTTCATQLAPGAGCTANVAFTPATPGTASGQLVATFISTATGTPVTSTASAALGGTGVSAIQIVMPASLSVGTYVIGLAPATATAVVKNTGSGPAAISAIGATAPFGVVHDCPATLAAGQSCTLTVSLAGTTVGPVTGNVSVTTAAGTQLIALDGTVAPAAISLAPVSIDFGTVLVHRASDPHDVVATNTTALDVPLGTLSVTPPFRIESSTCGTFLGAHGSCTVRTTFAPTQGGPATGTLSLGFGVNAAATSAPAPKRRGAKAASATAASVSLAGTGLDAAVLDMPSIVEFGTYIPGNAPIVRTVTLTNSGTGVVTFNSISVDGPFTLAHDCPLNLAPGASCTLTLGYSSGTLGPAAGVVSIASNAVGGLRTISLGALTQARPEPVVSVSPVSISFGNRVIGTQSPSVRVTVSNSGGADAALGAMAVTSDYVVVGTTCTAVLAPQASCTTDVAMRPIGFGARPGSLSFTANDGKAHGVGLGGNGCRPFSASANRTGSDNSCAP